MNRSDMRALSGTLSEKKKTVMQYGRKGARIGSSRRREAGAAVLLGILSLFFCGLFIGRFGIFGSEVDWISQHSVIPEYFRQQFYETGELFPEFAPNIGGGQNIYNFSYYGLYSPVILLSYLFPAVKMGDFIMAGSMCLAAFSAVLFYLWLRSRDFSVPVSFWSAMMLELSGPLIFHSARHVMFVNYMPFLIMSLWGIDRYFGNEENTGKGNERCREKTGLCLQRTFCGPPWLYIAGVFLMILSSFYFSVGGILVLCIYGLHRYAQVRRIRCKRQEQEPESRTYRRSKAVQFGTDAAAFLLPVVTAVCMSAFLLIPTAYALAGKRETASGLSLSALFTPDFYDFRLFYNAYGIGLTGFAAVALSAGLFWKKAENRILILSCISVLLLPVFPWILNGGLYPRDKALIPFLPLLCYVTALYARRMEAACDKAAGQTGSTIRKRKAAQAWDKGEGKSAAPYVVVVVLLVWQSGYGISDWTEALKSLLQTLLSGAAISFRQQRALLLLDALLMLLFYIIFRWKRNIRYLIVPPVVFLALSGCFSHGASHVVSQNFYERTTDARIGEAIEEVLSWEDGFYRTEQCSAAYEENMANVNRIWSMDQYVSSIYSSSFHEGYRNFCKETFGIEEPTRNELIQQVSQNPSFRRLAGVKYIVMQKTENASQEALQKRQREQLRASGYTLCYDKNGVQIYQNGDVAPIGYMAQRVISREAYEKLAFPYNQLALEYFSVAEPDSYRKQNINTQEEVKQAEEALSGCICEISLLFPEQRTEKCSIIPVRVDKNEEKCDVTNFKVGINDEKANSKDEYYKAVSCGIKAEKRQNITVLADGADTFAHPWVLYLQFTVKNAHPSSDVSVSVEGIRNKLSASTHLYKNDNTVFTYAVPMGAGQSEIELTLSEGEYELKDIRCFAAREEYQKKGNRAYGDGKSTGWATDRERSTGSRLTGTVRAEEAGWFVTSIPYDENFEVLLDGTSIEFGLVNTAFLGFIVPRGDHTVTLVYHASGMRAGKVTAVFGVLLLCIWGGYRLRRRIR